MLIDGQNILGNISSIETSGFVDGPGLRVVVFMQGCRLRCLYCHNPDVAFFTTEKTLMTPHEVVNKVKRYIPYFGKDGGVTFSGGDPLLQPEFLLETLKLCKQNGINTALDTSGVGDKYDELLDYVDLVILDVKAVDKDEYKFLTGQDIKVFKKFLKTCQEKKKRLWIRQVVVPGINDDIAHVFKLKNFVSKLRFVKKVELLPYHDMAKYKYEKLGIKYKLAKTQPMDKAECEKLQKILNDKNIKTIADLKRLEGENATFTKEKSKKLKNSKK